MLVRARDEPSIAKCPSLVADVASEIAADMPLRPPLLQDQFSRGHKVQELCRCAPPPQIIR